MTRPLKCVFTGHFRNFFSLFFSVELQRMERAFCGEEPEVRIFLVPLVAVLRFSLRRWMACQNLWGSLVCLHRPSSPNNQQKWDQLHLPLHPPVPPSPPHSRQPLAQLFAVQPFTTYIRTVGNFAEFSISLAGHLHLFFVSPLSGITQSSGIS